MMTKFKITLSVAIVVGTASAGFAAAKHHPIRHQPTTTFVQPGTGGSAFGFVPGDRTSGHPGQEYYIWVQDQYYND